MKKRAKFNLSNFHNCTFKMGKLYPTNLLEVLPGDTIQMSNSVFLRFAPMVAPVMHPTYMFMHHFFVPTRLIANAFTSAGGSGSFDFEAFITGGDDGENTATIPQAVLNASNSPAGSLSDAFGLPVQMLKGDSSFSVSLLPFIAYYMIYNEYYRDQDLQEAVPFNWPSVFTNPNVWTLCAPCWSKDYFTTARPWPQKGPEVTVPVNAPGGGVTGNVTISPDGALKFSAVDGSASFYKPGGSLSDEPSLSLTSYGTNQRMSGSNNGTLADFPVSLGAFFSPTDGGTQEPRNLQYASGLSGTFNSTTPGGVGSVNINDLREAFAIQRFEEHRSLWGSRYEDLLRYLGVKPQDARLQLPEYLGGFSSPVQFSEVLQTSAQETGGVGDMYGHGIAAARGRRIRRFIPEHGYIMSLICVRPISVYSQGIERLWSKKTKYDFWTKELEHIGQQEVLNSEVYADGTSADGNVFGYQNRYDEYRRGVSVVTGEFRTNQDFWTLARIFANRPALNSSFVQCNPSDRIFQVGEQNSDQLYCMVKNNIIAKRLISRNGNPI